ncbi:MAG TPA: autotransporter outer membrane beta-barrel domain-containing protein [Bordetella sp.]|nr:autotransporter outer membrane beta-barrel domain-containing protein [Bordetella sp.]
MSNLRFAMPLLAIQLAAADAAAEETSTRRGPSLHYTWSDRGGDFDIPNPGDFTTIPRGLSGPGALRKRGNGDLRLTGDNTYTGGTHVEQGVLRVGNGVTSGSIVGNVTNHGLMEFDREDGVTFAGHINGRGSVHYIGTGAMTLTGDHSYAGITVLADGTLRLGDGGGTGSLAGDIYNHGGTLVVDRSDTLRMAGALHGHGTVIQAGTGTLELTGKNTITGTLAIAAGTLRTGAPGTLSAAMHIRVARRATLDTANTPQTVAGLVNAGVVTLGARLPAHDRHSPRPDGASAWTAPANVSGSPGGLSPRSVLPIRSMPGNVLTVLGDYVGHGGLLHLRTSLGGSDSPTDRLVIDGGRASGRTIVAIHNTGGLGAATRGDGIEVIRAMNGATTTAQTTRDAFALRGGQVDAGAYEYRLYAADANGAGESWYLRSTVPVAAPDVTPDTLPVATADVTAGTPPGTRAALATTAVRPSYRAEMALYAALPAVLMATDLAMLGDLHRRQGEDAAPVPVDPGASRRRAWGRVIDRNTRIRQQGTVAPRSDGWTSGVQLGTDLYAGTHDRAGIYGGTLGWRNHVHGDAGGIRDRALGRLQGRSNILGAYWTHTGDAGWYGDAVLQHSYHHGKANAVTGSSADIRARVTLVSVEAGVPLRLSRRWTGEPQAQIVAAHRRIDDATIPAATVRQHPGNSVIARLGLRLKGDYTSVHGQLQPYARANLWHGLPGTDSQSIQGPGGATRIDEARGYTSGEIAAGGTWVINRNVGVYGEIGRVFPLGGQQRVSAGHTISAGLRLAW